jgi:hypothetical protein
VDGSAEVVEEEAVEAAAVNGAGGNEPGATPEHEQDENWEYTPMSEWGDV